MTSRVLFARLAPLARRSAYQSRPAISRISPRQVNFSNVPYVRPISFARALPRLVSKFATMGAAAGGATIAGMIYIQNQAAAGFGYLTEVFGKAKDGAGTAVDDVYQGASDTFTRIKQGWQATKAKVDNDWLQAMFETSPVNKEPSGHQQNSSGPDPKGPRKSAGGSAAIGIGATSALGFAGTDGEASTEESAARDEQMMLLTKKMIQIRTLLQSIGQSETLTLPSIVVIGSQSSGKSSVLEAIVGHEFLPKGNNMVTRRPIELTLINTPDLQTEYAEFPAQGLSKITDFAHVQRLLTDLNLAVPPQQCVSDDPIQLQIYSPNVPDLSLIDLPGYIQVVGSDQPPELKEKIVELCEKYIKPPNVILAISAADVDLANSTALRASRQVDPRGERTIGVITKMDLVEPEYGRKMLTDKKYALKLGSVGVVCRIPSSTPKLFRSASGNLSHTIDKNERAFFSSHSEYSSNQPVSVGVPRLKHKLMHVLEQTMAFSLTSTSETVRQELSEANYEFKVQYNERPLSAESHLAESLDLFKHAFRGFSETFGREHVRALLKHELDQQVLNILAQKYWNRPVTDLAPAPPENDPITDLPKIDPENPLWTLKLDTSTSSLTKSGIGRLATTVVASSLQTHINTLIANSTFSKHPSARQVITEASTSILRGLSYDISDELEICIKPYKYKILLEDLEWANARVNIAKALKGELKDCEIAIQNVEDQVGGKKKLRDIMAFIDRVRTGEVVLEGDGRGGAGGYSSALLSRGTTTPYHSALKFKLTLELGQDAIFLRDRAGIIQLRLTAIKSKQCASRKNKYNCPEVFLDAVADKLTTTADLFLDAEMLAKFYYIFPRELDTRLGRSLSQAEVDQFASEDPKIKRHLDLVRRKDLLEHAMKEIDALRHLESRERSRGLPPYATEHQFPKHKSWGIFS